MLHGEQVGVGGDALTLEGLIAIGLSHLWEVEGRLLGTDLAVGLAADEGKVGDVIGLPGGCSALENSLGEDVVELQLVSIAHMAEGYDQVGMPIAGIGGLKGQEHRLEQGAALIATFQLLRGDIQPTHLRPQPIKQLLESPTIAQDLEVLIEQGFARTSAVAALGIGEQDPAAQALRFSGCKLVRALGAIEAQADQQERRGQQGGASDAGIAAQEVDGELHAAATVIPAGLQQLNREVGYG